MMARPAAALASVATWLLVALLALAAGASSLGWAVRPRIPQLAPTIWPVDNFGLPELVDFATDAPGSSLNRGSAPALPPEIASAAADALSAEPTTAAALRALALHHQAAGRDQRALVLMRLAVRITKRDEVANLWLIGHDLRAGRLDAALHRYDQTVRTIGGGRGYVVATMAAALVDPGMIPPFYRLLRTEPSWAPEFWNAAAQTLPALDNAARLRIALAGAGVRVPRDKDELLLAALVGQRLFPRAYQLDRALRGGAAHEAGALANGDFSRDPGGSPLDWQLTSSGDVGASIDPRASVLEISAASGARGPVARHLVRLDPGRYRLEVALAGAARDQAAPLSVELTCAERDGSYGERRYAVARQSTHTVDLSATACRHHWLTLSIDAANLPDGIDLGVDAVRLSRI